MLPAELLDLLVCPETLKDLTLATSEEIVRLNDAIKEGQVRNVAGKQVSEPIEGALVRIDRAIAYPVREGIPVMLVPEGLIISGLNLVGETKA